MNFYIKCSNKHADPSDVFKNTMDFVRQYRKTDEEWKEFSLSVPLYRNFKQVRLLAQFMPIHVYGHVYRGAQDNAVQYEH